MVKYLIEQGAEVNGTHNQTSTSPLVKSIYNQSYNIVKELIRAGVNVNEKGEGGETPLKIAVELGDKRITKYLLRSGAIVTASILKEAAAQNNDTLFKMLIDSDEVNMNLREAADGKGAIHVAAANGSLHVIQTLMEYEEELDITTPDNEGMTPLMHAVINEHELIVAQLVDSFDCNVNQIDAHGRTVLQMALEMKNESIMRLLLATYGIDSNVHYEAAKLEIKKADQEIVQNLNESGIHKIHFEELGFSNHVFLS
eukprot:CAMPEP_0117419484 /NCGR_PEP_ID=MMETSP0758-20121206/1028_1 /TAXON_ID=63605 /ORGANISM="Percolomonas cosmopolitus, Strain AE-1 (ATCC 50343)" /LENGTH=255 /DNA_ID=CAMNT_0005200559 /DNA_START=212 /DNA_END=979 /DNA_ORIENTATION=-